MAYITCKKCGSQMSAMSEQCPLCGWPAGMDYDPKTDELAKQRLSELQATQSKPNENTQVEPARQLPKQQILTLFYSLLSVICSMSVYGIHVVHIIGIILCLASGGLGAFLSFQELELSKKQSNSKQYKIGIAEIPFICLIVSALSIVNVIIRIFVR